MSKNTWIGVDLDRTLAHYDHWRGPDHVGEPIMPMLQRVKDWLNEGREVRIVTARVGPGQSNMEKSIARSAIRRWCATHIGQDLEITCQKDYGMIELWDDRCVQVIPNTGQPVERTTDQQ